MCLTQDYIFGGLDEVALLIWVILIFAMKTWIHKLWLLYGNIFYNYIPHKQTGFGGYKIPNNSSHLILREAWCIHFCWIIQEQ